MPDATRIAVLVVDDHTLFRESVARMLNREPDLEVVGHAGSIEEATAVVGDRRVDLVLLDFELGQRDGLDFLRESRLGASTKTLIVTAGVEPNVAAELIRAGVSGIFLKRASSDSLIQAIREAATGRVSFDRELLRQAITDTASPRRDTFTDRERQVLNGVFEGLANKEIAARIGVSESSIKSTLQ